MAELLMTHDKVVGLKQTARALAAGRAKTVYLACDADPLLTDPLRKRCGEIGIPVEGTMTMVQLGHATGVAVGTAACAILFPTE